MGLTKLKGDLAEAKVLTFLVKEGFHVLLPWSEDCRYDLAAEKNGRFLRIQIKFVSPRNGRLSVPLRSANNWKAVKYRKEEIDIIAAYNPENDRIYFIPFAKFNNTATINLRLASSKNKQTRKIILADNYDKIVLP